MKHMTTAEFVEDRVSKGTTKYRLAQNLKLTPTSITQYLKGTKMSLITAGIVRGVYNVHITDAYSQARK